MSGPKDPPRRTPEPSADPRPILEPYRRTGWWTRRRLAIAGIVALVTWTVCLAIIVANQPDDDDESPEPVATSSTIPPIVALPVPANCSLPDPAVRATVEDALRNGAAELDKAYQWVTHGELSYLSADVLDAEGKRLAEAALWYTEGDDTYAVTAEALVLSDLPSAEEVLELPPGTDGDARAARACTINAP